MKKLILFCITLIILSIPCYATINYKFANITVTSGTHNGLDNTGFGLTSCTWTASTKTLNKSGAFSAYTVATGDYIYISSATAGTVGLYTVASKTDSDNIVLGTLISGAGIAGNQSDVVTGTGAWTLAEAQAGAAAGDMINFKGTYTLSGTFTLANAGTTTAFIWWRGYYAVIGDLEPGGTWDNDTGKFPTITCGTGYVASFTGPYARYWNIYITSARTAAANPIGVGAGSNGPQYFFRVKFEATGANANSNALGIVTSSSSPEFKYCEMVSSTTATRTINVANSTYPSFKGCNIHGSAGNGIESANASAGSPGLLYGNLIHDVGYGVYCQTTATTSSSGSFAIINNSFDNITHDAIYFSTLPPLGGFREIFNNVYSRCGGYGINQATGGNTCNLSRSNNYGVQLGTGMDVGFGDFSAVDDVDDHTNTAATVFQSVTSGNAAYLKFNAGMTAVGVAFPQRKYIGEATLSYGDIGALQRVEPVAGAGSGGNNFISLLFSSGIIFGLFVLCLRCV
jgi:hypothetical protein